MDDKTKRILLALVRDLEDLRAIVGLLLADSPRQSSILEAQVAKKLTKQENQQHYDELKKEIEAL